MSVRYYGAAPEPEKSGEKVADKPVRASVPDKSTAKAKRAVKRSGLSSKIAVLFGIFIILGTAVLAGGFFCAKLFFSGPDDGEQGDTAQPVSDGCYYSGREVGGGDYFGEQTRLFLNDNALEVSGYEDGKWVLYLSGIIDESGQYVTDYRLKYNNVYTEPMVSYQVVERTDHHIILVPSGDAASGRYAVFYSDLSAGGQDADRHDVLFKDNAFQVLEERTALYSLIQTKKFTGKDDAGNDIIFQMLDETKARFRIIGGGFDGRDLSVIFDNGIRQEVESGDRVIQHSEQYGDVTEVSSIESKGEFYSYNYDYTDGVLTITVYDSGDRNGRVYQLTE